MIERKMVFYFVVIYVSEIILNVHHLSQERYLIVN